MSLQALESTTRLQRCVDSTRSAKRLPPQFETANRTGVSLKEKRCATKQSLAKRKHTRSRRERRWFKCRSIRFAPLKKDLEKKGPVRSPHTCTSWGRMMTVRYVGIITLRSVTCLRRRFSFSLLCVYPYTTSLFSHLVCEFRNRNVHKIVISSPFQCV